MKEQYILYLDTKNCRIFANDLKVCGVCKEPIQGFGLFYTRTNPGFKVGYFHQDCFKDWKDIGQSRSLNFFYYVEDLPDNVLPIFLRPTELANFKGDMNTFQAAETKEKGVKIVDKTVFAARTKKMIDLISDEQHIRQVYLDIKAKDRRLTLSEADRLLESIKKSKVETL